MVLALISIFIIGYTCIALEHPLKVNKTATALLLGTALWAVFSFCNIIFRPDLDIEQWRSFISGNLVENLGETAEIVFFLLGAMTIVTLVEDYQGFRIITDKITTTNKKKLLWELSILTFFLSALLDNMTTAIVMCALLSKLIAERTLAVCGHGHSGCQCGWRVEPYRRRDHHHAVDWWAGDYREYYGENTGGLARMYGGTRPYRRCHTEGRHHPTR